MEYNILSISFILICLFIALSIPAKWIKFYTASSSSLLNIFFSHLFFLLCIVLVFALLKSHFNSVFLLLLFPIFHYIVKIRPKISKTDLKDYSKEVFVLIPLVIVTGLVTYLYIVPKSIEADVIYYSKIASYLQTNGTENYYHYYNELLTGNLGLMPYHYFELWLTALLSSVTGFTSVLTLKFIVYPYLTLVFIIGLLGLYEHFTNKKANLLRILIGFLLTLIIGYFGQLLSIKCSGWDILLSIWTRPNFILYSIGLIPLILALKDRNYHLLIISGSMICLFSVTAIPAVLASFFLFIAYNFIIKAIKLKEALIYSGIMSSFILFYILFYYFNNGDFSLIESKPITGIIAIAFKIWKATVGTFLNITLRCLAFLLLFIFLKKKKFFSNDIVVYFTLLTVISVGAFQLLSQLDNSYQIPHFGFCMLSILLLLSILFFLQNAKTVILLAAIFPLLYFAYYANKSQLISKSSFWDNRSYFTSQKGLSDEFVHGVANKLDSSKGICGFYIDSEKIKKTEHRYRTELTLQPMLELAYYTNGGNMVCLNKKEQILEGEGRGKEILEVWYKTFPQFSNEEDPFSYLQKGKVNSLLISEKGLNELNDSLPKNNLKKIEESTNLKLMLFYK